VRDNFVDFHLHTTCSDGAWTPKRLFDEVRARGLEYFCVSDHDTVDAYPVPADLRSRCVSGLEIDTENRGQTVHVLAYGMNQFNGGLMSRLRQQRENRAFRGKLIVERLNQLGVDLSFDDVVEVAKTTKSVGRPHIARALVAKNHCPSIQAAFDVYLAEGCGAYVPLERLATAEAVDLIHEAGAVAILAHPKRLRDQHDLSALCKVFDGVEVVHPTADSEYERQLFDLVDSHDMLASGGTDFHARPGEGDIGIAFSQSRVKQLLEAVGA